MFKMNLSALFKNKHSYTGLFATMLVFAVFGLVSSFILSVEKLEIIKNPDAILSCSFNLILNCATVMQTWQAELFGFPNSYIGMMAYPIVMTVAIAGIVGVRIPRNFMFTAQIFYILGLVFAYWLFFQSVYVIQVLCPWCLVVTLSTTIIVESLTRYNILNDNLHLPKSIQKSLKNFVSQGYDKLVVAAWISLMVVLVLLKFGDGLFA